MQLDPFCFGWGERILNGMFGVEKPTVIETGEPILRVITNLIPTNSVLQQLQGSVKNLPSITSWMSCVADEDDIVKVWQSDMSNAFYLFRLPSCWRGFLAFNVSRPGSCFVNGGSETFYLACNVLPMGWLSSVSVMQEVSENLILRHALLEEYQLSRNKAIPLWMVGLLKEAKASKRAWWHVYLDNFAAGQILGPDEKSTLRDQIHNMAEDAWAEAQVLSSEKKRKRGCMEAEELGGFVSGKDKTLGPSGKRLLSVIHSTLWVLDRPHLSKKHVQVIAGRWAHILQFRRPGMSVFEATWEFAGSKKFSLDLVRRVRRELFACITLAPLLHANLSARVSDFLTASDASNTGGAVGIAYNLTDTGRNFLDVALQKESFNSSIPVLVISLFNGIGGAFRCYDILGVAPMGLVSFEIHKPANRVTSRRWPHRIQLGDVREFTKEKLWEILLKFPGVKELHLWAGFPCVDLSAVKWNAKGLDGPQSSLFFEVVRILRLLNLECRELFVIKFVAENVASMNKKELARISDELGVSPYFLDCSQAVPMNRPCLCWTSEDLTNCVEGIEIKEAEHWWEVSAINSYPDVSTWIEPGYEWSGAADGDTLPTCMKAICRRHPPPRPAGINRCDEATLSRWRADDHNFPPYHYLERFVFFKGDRWRLCDSVERELLLGYGYNHTELCFSASEIKQSQKRYENERLSILFCDSGRRTLSTIHPEI